MSESIYKAGPGWVKRFDDGTIIGPFETRDQAEVAQKVSNKQKSADSEFKKFGSVDKN